MTSILKVSSLSKSFFNSSPGFFYKKKFEKIVLKDIDFNAKERDCIALLGENGSGKTTLLKLIAGLLSCDKGSVKNNLNMAFDPTKISLVNSNERSFFWRLSVGENLKFFCSLSNQDSLKKIKETLSLLKVSDKVNLPFMNLSQGEKKKISIARALLSGSKILLLDEFTNSLDINAKKLVISTLRGLLNENHLQLIIFATHSIDEVLSLSNRLIYIKDKTIFEDRKVNKETQFSDIEILF
tara:strand:- start:1027 stop:1746 length:720 start_codon:yes stop_codon:yes gene_type:complete